MILNRLGNKKGMAHKIYTLFPKHEIYVEPFFGASGMFFSKPKAKYNIVNDDDDNVFNLFQVVQNNREELYRAVELMPIHASLMRYWNKNKETDPIKKAMRFLFLSNFGYIGMGETLNLEPSNSKQILLSKIEPTFERLKDVVFDCSDFRKFLKSIKYRGGEKDKNRAFIYCDPPYLGTSDNYSNSFKVQDSTDLLDVLIATGVRFAVSEFANPIIIDLAKEHNLNVIEICKRQTMKSRNTEILITNYTVSNGFI